MVLCKRYLSGSIRKGGGVVGVGMSGGREMVRGREQCVQNKGTEKNVLYLVSS